jgi:hypothetical protein
LGSPGRIAHTTRNQPEETPTRHVNAITSSRPRACRPGDGQTAAIAMTPIAAADVAAASA